MKYCNLDCIILHQILINFKKIVYDFWSINIEDCPTASSLSTAIYSKHYLESNTIPITNNKVYDFIKDSYTGGSTDMFIPYGKNIKCYDVNSLYPSVMRNNLFPVGKIMQFEGDINILPDIY